MKAVSKSIPSPIHPLLLSLVCVSAASLTAQPASDVHRPHTPATVSSRATASKAHASSHASRSAALAGRYAATAPAFPKVEVFLGYSYLRAIPTYATGNRLVYLHGGSASVAFNINRYLGIVADGGGFADSELNLTGPGVVAPGVVASGGNAYTFLFGPRLSYRKYERLTPFAQVLAGGIHASPVTLSNCTGAGCVPLPAQTSFALTAGGGLDFKLKPHIALRLFQAEYLLTRFDDPTTSAKNTQNDVRLSGGVLFGFGGSPAALPLAYACSASPASVYPGDQITVTGAAENLNPKRTATYSWTTDGGQVSGSTAVATVDTKTVAPGTYTVRGHVSEGARPGYAADCSAGYTVLAFQPPSVSCSANPSTVEKGSLSTITTQASSPQGRPLTYSYAASAGSINGSAATATLSTATDAGVITVTCNVVDDKGLAASATTTVSVQATPAALAPATNSLCSLNFARDARRPTRVDNEAKACLDDIALNLQRSSDAKLALIGHSDPSSRDAANAAAMRAANARAYLLRDKGIDASRLTVYTGQPGTKTVDTILIPAGATLDTSGLTPAPQP